MFFFFLGAREAFDSPELERFGLALETAQARCPGLTLGAFATLMRIGVAPRSEGDRVAISVIVDRSPGQKYSTIARQIDLLCDGYGSTAGLELVEKETDADDRRMRYVAVSERGKALLQELDLILAPARAITSQS